MLSKCLPKQNQAKTEHRADSGLDLPWYAHLSKCTAGPSARTALVLDKAASLPCNYLIPANCILKKKGRRASRARESAPVEFWSLTTTKIPLKVSRYSYD